MIISVKVKNLARWKGEHEINYKEGINILDGKYGVGKSSLLVDAFQLVMTNSARVSFDEIITKGESEGEVEVLWETLEGEKYKFYWYHKLKRTIQVEDKKTGKLKETQEPGKTIWEVLEYSSEEEDYVKSFKSPEQILGIPYSIASKTFLIKQNDIDGFSNAGPTEKYDIIADSFNISMLFKIGDKATEKLKKLQTEKNVLLEDLKDINITDFEKITELEENSKVITVDITNLNTLEKQLLGRREEIRTSLGLYNQIVVNRQRVLDTNKLITELSKIDLDSLEKEKEQIKLLLEKESLSEIEKIESELSIYKGKKAHLDELSSTKIKEAESYKNLRLRSLYQELNDLQLKYTSSRIENSERFTDEYIEKLSKFSQEELTKKYQEKTLEYQNLDKEKQVLTHRQTTNENIIQKINNLQESTCPTCFRGLSQDEKSIVVSKFIEEREKIERELIENHKVLTQVYNELQEITTNLNELIYLQKFLENKQYGLLGKQKQEEYKKIEGEENTKLEEIKNQYGKEISETTAYLVSLQSKYEQLVEKSKAKEYQAKLKELENKTFLVEGRTYTAVEVKTSIVLLNDQVVKIEKENSELLVNLKITNEQEYVNKLNLEFNENIAQGEKLLIDRQQKQDLFYALNTQLTTLKGLKDRYEKVKGKVGEYNEKLERFEKISSIFGKKGQPKTIIEKIIVPQLELKTNTILDKITDGKYQVEFSLTSITQEGKESKKNTFDIYVHQDGIKQVYDSLSGGEKMNINYAIRLGITECLNDLLGKSTSDILVLDEAFNAIDSDASEEQILRSIKETSKLYKQVFIITHVNELKEGLQGVSTVYSIVKNGKYSILEK